MNQVWVCVVCEHESVLSLPVEREGSLCENCMSTWRNRASVLAIGLHLGYGLLPLPKWPQNWAVQGAGCDDSPVLFSTLPTRTLYTNTHLERFPYLDLTDIPEKYESSLDYFVCGDVLEHVESGQLSNAIIGIAKLLKPTGFAVISVPIVPDDLACEIYPDSKEAIVAGPSHVRWQTADGRWIDDYEPEFHGGSGRVLAFRRFSNSSIIEAVTKHGLTNVTYSPTGEALGIPPIDNGGIFVARK